MTVSVGFLGGLGEVGRNCAVLEIDGELMLLDCGVMFPGDNTPGVDLILPDFSFVVARSHKVRGIILTHGHEDHIGAIPYLLRELKAPVYGGLFTIQLALAKVEALGIESDMRTVNANEWIEEGPFRFIFVPVTHSIPEARAVIFETPEGVIVHTGDFKLDPTPIGGVSTDLATFAELGRDGVRLLLSDSTNAERPGYVPSEATVGDAFRSIVGDATGRVVVACFASHIHRVQQALDAIVDSGRYFSFLGRSMLRNTTIAHDLGLLDYPEEKLVGIKELAKFSSDQVAIVCTGSQAEPRAALSLMAADEHRTVGLAPRDTVIISATPIPGNETRVSRLISDLTRLGADVYHGRNSQVHVSGHASQDELAMLLKIVTPEAFVPVHGEYRHLAGHAALASANGIPEVNVLEDGDRVVLDGGRLSVERGVLPAGYVCVVGDELGDFSDVLRDRRQLANDGVLVVILGVEVDTCSILYGPQIASYGITGDSSVLHDAVEGHVRQVVLNADAPADLDALRQQVRVVARKVAKDRLGHRPIVLPLLTEI